PAVAVAVKPLSPRKVNPPPIERRSEPFHAAVAPPPPSVAAPPAPLNFPARVVETPRPVAPRVVETPRPVAPEARRHGHRPPARARPRLAAATFSAGPAEAPRVGPERRPERGFGRPPARRFPAPPLAPSALPGAAAPVVERTPVLSQAPPLVPEVAP